MFYLFNAKPSNIGLLRTLEQQTQDAVVPFKYFTEKEIRKLWSFFHPCFANFYRRTAIEKYSWRS